MAIVKDLGVVTAYAYAVAGGYEGTEAEFTEALGRAGIVVEQLENLTAVATTLSEGSEATASYADGVLTFGIPKGDTGATGPQGEQGVKGDTGNGIVSIAKTATVGKVDTYTITFTDGATTTFDVTNGADGDITNVAQAFDATKAYSTGDMVLYQGMLYAFTAAHAAGAWVGSDAQAVILADEVTALKDDLDDINNYLGTDVVTDTALSGYNPQNSLQTNNRNSPFVPQTSFDFTGYVVDQIKLNIYQTGTISIGTIKKSKVVTDVSYNRNDAVLKTIVTADTIGEQIIDIPEPFTVESDEYLWFGMPSDTARWIYGAQGENIFWFAPSGGTWSRSPNSLGVDVYVSKTERPEIRSLVKSVYEGKTLSILGDSISTFDGYIPVGNATYYPAGTVTAVTDTWWKKLIDALGMTLNINNSWSGSRVTTTDGETSAGCMARCEALGTSPDVIIVWMGINDFNNEVELGTYDGTTAIPSTTTTFKEAYAIMLNKILTAYPRSEVWVCTLPQCERNAETGFPEINGNGVALTEFNKAIRELANAFGVMVLEHDKCGLTYQNMPVFNPDNLHPNKFGHSLVANNDIKQMDNAIYTRYPIS